VEVWGWLEKIGRADVPDRQIMSYVYNLGQIRGGLKNGLNWPEITL